MMQVTLDANDETNPPSGFLRVLAGQTASYSVAITGTISVTLNRKVSGGGVCPVEDAYTASTTKQIVAPGEYQLIASGTSGGSAVTQIGLD
jgi:hypothetical protein